MSSKSKPRKKKPGRPRSPLPTRDLLAAAIAKHREGNAKEAAATYRKILSSSPGHADALHFLGVAEHQLGESEQALTHIGRALELVPHHPDALNNRGNVLKQLGRLDEAEADYRRVLELRPQDTHALNNLGVVLRYRGELDGAVVMFRRVIALEPDHAPAWQNLGNALKRLDRLEEALDAYREAMRLAPQAPSSYRYLAAMLHALGRVDEANQVLERWLALFPDDPRARHYSAASTGKAVPGRASDDVVRAEFDTFAPDFDATLSRLEYRAPTLVAEEVERVLGAKTELVVLDAGCGTGLCAPLLRPRARSLIGVDLSMPMIELARKRGLYDALVVEELTAYLRGHPASSDLVVSADTLVYFGDLSEVITAAARALRSDGVLVFTVERATEQEAPAGYRLNPHGRYGHTQDYLLRVLARAGYGDLSAREVTLRKEAAKWVEGLLVSARAPSALEGVLRAPPPRPSPPSEE